MLKRDNPYHFPDTVIVYSDKGVPNLTFRPELGLALEEKDVPAVLGKSIPCGVYRLVRLFDLNLERKANPVWAEPKD